MNNKQISGSYTIIDEKKKKARLTVSMGYDGNGKQIKKRKTVSYEKKADIKTMLREFENEIANGRGSIGADVTLDQMMATVINSKRARGVRESTLHGYEAAKAKTVAYFGTKRKAKTIRRSDINSWIEDLIDDGLSPKTIKNYVTFLFSCYEQMIDDDVLLMENPCHHARLPKMEHNEKETLKLDQVRPFYLALHEYFDDMDLIACYELALGCGLRRSEILGLTWDAIDLDNKTLSIRQTRHLVNGETFIEQPKTDQSRRTIKIPDFIVNDLRRLRHDHRLEKIRYGVEGYTDGYVILDEYGQPIGSDRIRQILRTFEKRSGFPDITMHGLRHTYASMLNNFGSDIVEISSQLGHANKSITLNVYTHLFEDASHVSGRIAADVDKFIAANDR